MTDRQSTPPSLETLVSELRLVRARGLTRLRDVPTPNLVAVVAQVAGDSPATDHATAIENTLRTAVRRLGEGTLGIAAADLFGLSPETRGVSPTELRKRAAATWGVTAESFRKQPERTVIEQIALRILQDLHAIEPITDHVAKSSMTTTVAYHGTSIEAANSILVEGFRASRNRFDWLGDGIYFFQDSSSRAIAWAKTQHADWAILQARIDLRDCLDLLDHGWFSTIEEAHDLIIARHRRLGLRLPIQTEGAHGIDRMVINETVGILTSRGMNIRSVRSVFQEGRPAYPGSALFDRSHIQIAVRDPQTISAVGFYAGD